MSNVDADGQSYDHVARDAAEGCSHIEASGSNNSGSLVRAISHQLTHSADGATVASNWSAGRALPCVEESTAGAEVPQCTNAADQSLSKNMLRKKKYLDQIDRRRKLFFKFLNKSSTKETLAEVFGRFGEVVHLRIPFSRKKKRNLGYGYVIFSSPEPIDHILSCQGGVEVDGKVLSFHLFDNSKYEDRSPHGAPNPLSSADIEEAPSPADLADGGCSERASCSRDPPSTHTSEESQISDSNCPTPRNKCGKAATSSATRIPALGGGSSSELTPGFCLHSLRPTRAAYFNHRREVFAHHFRRSNIRINPRAQPAPQAPRQPRVFQVFAKSDLRGG